MNNKKEYTFLWFIENYSYCWHKNGEMLVSPDFTADELEGTGWSLKLYPRGYGNIDEGGICMYLNRNEDGGPDVLTVSVHLSVVREDGSNFFANSHTCDFSKDTQWGFSFVVTDDVLQWRKAEYLPKDILTVRCRLRNSKGNTDKVAPICARTRIGIEHISFLHALEGFGALEPNHKKTFHIRSPSKNERVISCRVYVCDGMVMIEITPLSIGLILAKCEISLLEVSGKKIKCVEADNRFDASKKVIDKLTLSLTKDAIMSKKNEYLPHDKLSLLCECTFSTGIEFQQIEGTLSYYSDIKQIFTEKLSVCASALDDLKDIYSNNFLTDVELKTETNSFPAHKIVLCARSPVFKAMFGNDMRESNSDSIQVDDLEDDTVQQLLLFLYSDKLEDLQWDTATKLYYAADKYQIEKLKLVCSCFLVDNLSTSTVTELLVLADTHSDSDLKKAVEDFILDHEEQVFRSDQWEKLMEANPQLAVKIMHVKYKAKEVRK